MRTVLLCPFNAGSVLWQAQSGAWTLTVCVRATFNLVHGREAVLSDVQEPIAGDRHYDEDPRQSLYAASELALYKPRTDVMLVGSAFAPDREPVEAFITRLSIGELDKSLGVVGDRVWIDGPDGPEPSAPRPFTRMPLRYERAVRAPDNPVGFDLTRAPQAGALALPNLEAADDEIGRGRTVGFGPVSPMSRTRRSLLSAEAWAWLSSGGRGPLPASFDFAFYNAAPRDQQIELLRAGATIVLENMSLRHPRLETRLPVVRPKAFLVPNEVERGSEIALRCDTVWIDTDRGVVTLSWRGIVAVPSGDEEELGALVIAAESKGREIGYRQITKLLRDGLNTTTDSDTLNETNPLSVRHDRVHAPSAPRMDQRYTPPGAARPLPAPASAPAVPVAAPAPVVIQGEDTGSSATPIWDELSSSELLETTLTDEPATLQRHHESRQREDSNADGPTTAPMLARPGPPPGGLQVSDYARIAAAMERGEAARALFDYGLTMPDLPAVTRAWSERIAVDPAFAEAFARELSAARRR